jgi:hypothetical protein
MKRNIQIPRAIVTPKKQIRTGLPKFFSFKPDTKFRRESVALSRFSSFVYSSCCQKQGRNHDEDVLYPSKSAAKKSIARGLMNLK